MKYYKRTENNFKSLNFFKDVVIEAVDGNEQNSKILNVSIQEKPTGEIYAGAGVGTQGGLLRLSEKIII